MSNQEILDKQRDFILPSVMTYYEEPLVLERREGQHLYAVDGGRYLDFVGGILVASVGHCHPRVTERVCEQLRTLQHTSTLYLHSNMVDLAQNRDIWTDCGLSGGASPGRGWLYHPTP